MKTKELERNAVGFIESCIAGFAGEIVEPSCNHDEPYMSEFIGTVFRIMPSGKYYMPWACSNLNPCPQCGGIGNTGTNPHKSRKQWMRARRRSNSLRTQLIDKFGFYGHGFWPVGALARLRSLDSRESYFSPDKILCPHCDGNGTREGAMDEVFRDVMEKTADEHGYWLESGEGDPCDIFLCRKLNDKEQAEYNKTHNEGE